MNISRNEFLNMMIDNNMQDISINQHTITNNNCTFGNDFAGRTNKSIYANGVDQNVDLGNIGDSFIAGANGCFSVSFAITESSLISAGAIFAKHHNATGKRGYYISLTNGLVQVVLYNAGATSSSGNYISTYYDFGANTYNTRRLITVVYDNTEELKNKIKIYFNRNLLNITTSKNGTFDGLGSISQNVKLFSRSENTQWFNGILDKFLLNSVALNATEVSLLHNKWSI